MIVLQVCAYAAPYEGNFIKSLYALENELQSQGHCVYYAFPKIASNISWCQELAKRTKVFFLPLRHARLLPETYIMLRRIVKNEKIDIIHSHFELYDMACKVASSKHTKVFWHLHDPVNKSPKPGRNIINKLQYSIFSRNVTLLSVCEHYKDIVLSYGFKGKAAKTVVNGIDLERITFPYEVAEKKYDFLTFGWDFYRKGTDIILNVLKRLAQEGYTFKFLLNCNDKTKPYIETYIGDENPSWLEIGEPVEDINSLFCCSKTFIQASRRETFSYAVCEAAYAGMDVLSSDIYGLEWAHSIPSVSFFENENEIQLYNSLKQRLQKSKTLSGSVVEQSRRVIESDFSLNVWVNRILDEYEIQ